MKRQGTQHEEEPKNKLRPAHISQIPSTWYANIQRPPPRMSFVELLSCRTGDTLNCEITSSKNSYAQQVEYQVNNGIPSFDRIAIPFVQCANAVLLSNRNHGHYQKDQIDQEDSAGGTGRDNGSHSPTDDMPAALLKVEGVQFIVLEFFTIWVFELVTDGREN
jgi:hypothetical protein